MAFRNKAEQILSENPDILIIPECENLERLKFKKDIKKPTDIYWFGSNPNKGIAILSFNGYKIKHLSIHNPKFRFVIPLELSDDNKAITLFAVWSQKPEKGDNYGIHVWNAISYYSNLMKGENTIIAGDFNSSSIWDKARREANHSSIVKRLNEFGLKSTYHHFKNQKQGEEKDATLFLHRKFDRPYHIDYLFASKNLIKKLNNVKVGKYEKWTKFSDHKPLIVSFID